jgi:hypothetical protein
MWMIGNGSKQKVSKLVSKKWFPARMIGQPLGCIFPSILPGKDSIMEKRKNLPLNIKVVRI